MNSSFAPEEGARREELNILMKLRSILSDGIVDSKHLRDPSPLRDGKSEDRTKMRGRNSACHFHPSERVVSDQHTFDDAKALLMEKFKIDRARRRKLQRQRRAAAKVEAEAIEVEATMISPCCLSGVAPPRIKATNFGM